MENYSTFFLGNADQIKNVLVYSTKSFSDSAQDLKINGVPLSERKDVLDKITKTPDRSDVDDIVVYLLQLVPIIPFSKNITVDYDFNVIIYIDKNNKTIAATVFDKMQGTTYHYGDIEYISKETKITFNVSNNVKISDSDLPERGGININEAKNWLIGVEPWQYTKNSTDLLSNRKYNKIYTPDTNELLRNRSASYLLTSNSVVNIIRIGNIKTSMLKLPRNLKIDRISEAANLNRNQIGFINGDLVMYRWSEETGKYVIISLTKVSSVGTPEIITKPKKLGVHVYQFKDWGTKKLLGFSGTLAFFYDKENSRTEMYDVLMEKSLANEGYVIANTGDRIIWSKTIELVSYEQSVKLIPEIANVKFDIKGYLQNNFLRVIGLFNGWIVIEDVARKEYILCSRLNTIYTRNLDKVILINLNSAIADNTLYSDGIKGLNGFPGALDKFRRNALPDNMLDVKIIAAYGGLIYYTYRPDQFDNTKYINYL